MIESRQLPGPNFTVAILAGGAASRMGGADKASLPLDGRRIIDAQIEVLHQLSDSIIIVGGALDRFRDLGIPTVADACAEAGDAFTIQQMFVRRMPKSCINEDEIMRYCGLHHTDVAREALKMMGVEA